MSYSSWGYKELDMTEWLTFSISMLGTFIIVIYYSWIDPMIIMQCPSLSLVMVSI